MSDAVGISMEKKYRLEPEKGTNYFRVIALGKGPWGPAGTVGGFVSGDGNLAQEGDAWVGGNARVFGNARVGENALVGGDARVGGNARVFGDARVSGNARVGENALVGGNAKVDYLVQTINGSRNTITILRYEKCLQIGCEYHHIDHWLSNYGEIGLRHNYNKEQLAEYYVWIKACAEILRSEG